MNRRRFLSLSAGVLAAPVVGVAPAVQTFGYAGTTWSLQNIDRAYWFSIGGDGVLRWSEPWVKIDGWQQAPA